MVEIITYRLSVTGIWQYDFRLDGALFGKVSFTVSASEPVRIEKSPDLSWYSRFDLDTEIIPGTSRRVKSNKTGNEVFRIVWWRQDLYEIRAGEKSVFAEIRNGNYLFGLPRMPVTAMTERARGDSILIRGMEAESCFRTTFFEPVSTEYMMMVLSFPALRFC